MLRSLLSVWMDLGWFLGLGCFKPLFGTGEALFYVHLKLVGLNEWCEVLVAVLSCQES